MRPVTMVTMGEDHSTTADPVPPASGYPRLARDPERRILAGVCTGLGRFTGIDPVVFRVGFSVLVLMHGQGLCLYIAAALFMPARPGAAAPAEALFRRWFDAPAVLSILGIVLAAGLAFTFVGGQTSDALSVVTVSGLVLLVTHARGVNLATAARALPERLRGHPPAPESTEGSQGTLRVLREGMVDLATLGSSRTGSTAPPKNPAPPQDSYASYVPDPAPRTEDEEAADGKAAPAAAPCRGAHGRSSPANITLLAAMIVGAAFIPVADAYPTPDSWMIVMAPALAVVGFGLLAGGWFQVRGLATAGTVLTLALLTTSVAGEIPQGSRFGDIEWRPTDAARAEQDFKLALGSATLDLTALPVAAGQRVTVNAQVMAGELNVALPSAARVELDARVRFGDLIVGSRMIGGPGARAVEVLEPEGRPVKDPPVIVLRIRSKLGDVKVARV